MLVRPIPIINNLGLFARLISDLSVACDGDQLFRWIAANGGKAADYENLLTALRSFGAFKRAGDATLMHEQVLDPRNPVWLQRSTEKLYAGAIDGSALSVLSNYYSHPNSLSEVRQFAIQSWGYTPAEGDRIAATLKIINEEIWKRRDRQRRADKRDKLIVRVVSISVILIALLLLGMCAKSSDQDCDYTGRSVVCEPN